MNNQSHSLRKISAFIGLLLLAFTYSNTEAAETTWYSDDRLIEITAQPQYNDQDTISTVTLNITDKTLGEYQYQPLIYTVAPPYDNQKNSIKAVPEKSTLNGEITLRMLNASQKDLFIIVDLNYGNTSPPLQSHTMGSIMSIPINKK